MSKNNWERDWIESSYIKPIKRISNNSSVFPFSTEKSAFTIRDSSLDLQKGCEVIELDSIPGEFYDYVKLSS